MATIEEYRVGDSSWYDFGDGIKIQGEEKAQEYLDDLQELEEASAEEQVGADDSPDDGVVRSTDLVDDTSTDAAADDPEDEVEEHAPDQQSGDDALVRMTRQNRTYEVAGKGRNYTFTQDAQILVVAGEDVGDVIAIDGFELASPEQARQFYS